jgi:hypothetical protein
MKGINTEEYGGNYSLKVHNAILKYEHVRSFQTQSTVKIGIRNTKLLQDPKEFFIYLYFFIARNLPNFFLFSSNIVYKKKKYLSCKSFSDGQSSPFAEIFNDKCDDL